MKDNRGVDRRLDRRLGRREIERYCRRRVFGGGFVFGRDATGQRERDRSDDDTGEAGVDFHGWREDRADESTCC